MSTQTLPTAPLTAEQEQKRIARLAAQKYQERVVEWVGNELATVYEENDPRLKAARARIAMAYRDAAAANAQIHQCVPASVARCLFMTLLTGLSPGGVNPTCYLLPRFNKKAGGLELNWQVSHRGLVQLASRAGYGCRPVSVHEGDDFELDLSAIRPPPHRPAAGVRDWDNLLGAYVVIYRLDTGIIIGWDYMTKQQIEARRTQSDAWKRGQKQGAQDWERSSPWYQWPVEMALKTVIKWAAARGVLPTDDALGRAMEADADDAVQHQVEVQQPRQIGQRDPLDMLDPMDREREPELVEAEDAK